MAVAELQVECPALHRSAIADALDVQVVGEAFRHTGNQVLQLAARGTPHGAGAFAFVCRRHGQRTVLLRDAHVIGQPVGFLAQHAFGGHQQPVDFDIDAARHFHRFLADSRHCSFRSVSCVPLGPGSGQKTRQSTSPPTLASRAALSDSTPCPVDRIFVPRPPRSRFRSLIAE